MSSEKIKTFIQDQMKEIRKPSLTCFLDHGLNEYHQLSVLLQAAGHDTCELDIAMNETFESTLKLKAAREKAEKMFEEKGILFTVVPFEKEEKSDSA